MKNIILFGSLLFFVVACSSSVSEKRLAIAAAMEASMRHDVLDKWYPLNIDTLYGGYLSAFTYDFKPAESQDKMIVTQARHIWSNSKAAKFYPKEAQYVTHAAHGFKFLRDLMWDKEFGGFYQMIDRQGNVKANDTIKTAYGNAFGIFALAAYYDVSGDTAALGLAKRAFMWLEKKSHDRKLKGYYQHLKRDGTPIKRPKGTPSTSDLGYKDQNSSIHLLEAFTELYSVWPDALVKKRLTEMLELIRDTIVTSRGSLTLFLLPDWTPVSFRDSSKQVVLDHAKLDHISFGHDIETAFLLLEASAALGLKNDTTTERIAKKMVDHCLRKGWDDSVGGFYDEGYYFKGDTSITIIRDTKNWWAQAEGMNTLLLMADKYPNDNMRYMEKFEKQWNYCNVYLIDHVNGDWYAGGLDKQPDMKTALKGNIWKGNYHQLRSLIHCIERLRGQGH
jgi:cellobiose epimerase